MMVDASQREAIANDVNLKTSLSTYPGEKYMVCYSIQPSVTLPPVAGQYVRNFALNKRVILNAMPDEDMDDHRQRTAMKLRWDRFQLISPNNHLSEDEFKASRLIIAPIGYSANTLSFKSHVIYRSVWDKEFTVEATRGVGAAVGHQILFVLLHNEAVIRNASSAPGASSVVLESGA